MLKRFFIRVTRGFFSHFLNQKGSALVFSIFIITSLSLMVIAYWKAIEIYAESIYFNERGLQAYQIAKAGIEDAIYEVKQGNTWDDAGLLPSGWEKVSANEYQKSTALGSLDSTLFELNSTFSVVLIGDPNGPTTINITSTGLVSGPNDYKSFKRVINSKIIKSPVGEIYVLSMKEQ